MPVHVLLGATTIVLYTRSRTRLLARHRSLKSTGKSSRVSSNSSRSGDPGFPKTPEFAPSFTVWHDPCLSYSLGGIFIFGTNERSATYHVPYLSTGDAGDRTWTDAACICTHMHVELVVLISAWRMCASSTSAHGANSTCLPTGCLSGRPGI